MKSQHESLVEAIGGMSSIASEFGVRLSDLLKDFNDRVEVLEHQSDVARHKARKRKAAKKKKTQ